MGAAASVSMGNTTESNVINSTSNEQYFSMENIVKITNSMEQKTTNVNALTQKFDTSAWNNATVEIIGAKIKIGGTGNTVAINGSASALQNIEAIASANAIIEHVSNLTDAVMFDIANNGFSQQSSDMSSAATASSTTELEVSGIGTAAASVGINNTVCTNVNNSIRNVFSMAINNNMSSSTERSSLAESINSASQTIKMVNNNEVGIKIANTEIDVSGELNTLKVDATASSTTGANLQSDLTSNLKSSLVAETNTIASATSTVEASQKAKSSATASASQSQSTKLSTDGAIWAIAAAVMVGTICFAVVGVAKCKGKGNNTAPVVIVNNNNKPDEVTPSSS